MTWRYFVQRCRHEGYSKALLSRLVGQRDGLSSERTYVMRTLPTGILQGLGDFLMKGDVFGLARAIAILRGLVATVGGYVNGSISARLPFHRVVALDERATSTGTSGVPPSTQGL